MVEVWLPYGDTEVSLSVDLKNFLGRLEPEEKQPTQSANDIISKAFNEARGTKLEDLVGKECLTAIALEGTTSPNIATTILGEVVDRLIELIIPRDHVTIIIANGTREHSNQNLLKAIKNDDRLKGIQIVEHTRDYRNLSEIGTTNRRTPIKINNSFAGSTIKIAIGEVWLDAFTGFTGAHTAIIPGISGIETIEANRRHYFKGKDPGVLEDNPIKEDAFEVANEVGIDLAINLVSNIDGRLIDARIGSLEESWGLAITSLNGWYELESDNKADIVAVSSGGYRRDFDLYHSVWALKAAERVCKRNGTIILVAECFEGLGPDALSNMAQINQLSELERRYQIGAEAVHLIKKMNRNHKLMLVSVLPEYLTESLGFETARTANGAYENALDTRRRRKTLAIPYGCFTIPEDS